MLEALDQTLRLASSRPQIAGNIVELIGGSPLLRVHVNDSKCDIFLKLESFNPGKNVKDRAALSMIIQAERRGELRPGGTIIESSSGNTGLSLAQIGAARGYRVVIVVDNHVQPEKMAVMRAFGAEVEHVGRNLPANEQAAKERDERVRQLLTEIPNSYYVNQGDNLDNRVVHYYTTASEILNSVGPVDYFFASVGTGGTISGTGKRLKEANKNTKVVALEPKGSVFFGEPYVPFFLTGAGSTKEIWKNIDYSIIDQAFSVTDKQAFNTCRFFARKFGLLMGGTGGMVVFKIIQFVSEMNPSGKIVGLIPDGGEQYLSSIYDDHYMSDHDLFDTEVETFLGSKFAMRGVHESSFPL